MKIKRVSIKINDLRKYSFIAFFVDKPEFLEDIKNIRNGVIKRFYSRKDYDRAKQLERRFNADYQVQEKFYKNIKTQPKVIDDLLGWFYSLKEIDIRELVNKYHKPKKIFDDLIEAVILTNTVYPQDLHDDVKIFGSKDEWAIMDIVEDITSGNDLNLISIYPTTTSEDIKKALNKYKSTVSRPDTISNIKRDRDWYWLKLSKDKGGSGLSYQKIALNEWGNNKDKAADYSNTVFKAISQYKKKLESNI